MKNVYETVAELASRIRASRAVLRKWRLHKEGPPYVKMGGAIRYEIEAVNAWIKSRTVLAA